eukprot:TRINITY_DN59330_c0_g1_i1.p1 TRINITY_DN59330_c0_g1~~TRINITY_DN59330_c0_g1_i1.p1  ORF type:complete len:1131 (+),score=190.54 TRINITY_DN59330_c0_g1_i1:98-3490(+)
MATALARTAFRSVTFLKDDTQICDNKVITSHYTKLNFVPKNLMEQFSRPANLYFLFLCGLQMIPSVSTTGQIPTIALPLVFIIMLNGLKDLVEDYRRHKSDREENERITLSVEGSGEGARLTNTRWQEVRVGRMIVVTQNEFIPADMVLLSSAHEEGHCSIETANLDGETNLKTKNVPTAAFELVGECKDRNVAAKKASAIQGKIECELPNEFLYSFAGNITATGRSGQQKISLNEEHVLLRGCKLKNVAWVLGVVIYTGKESKIMMNSKEGKGRKLSHLDRQVSHMTAVIFGIQNLLCAIAAIISAIFETSPDNLQKKYLNLTNESGQAENAFVILVVRFFNFMILFSNFIPISLLVCMSIVKFLQVFFLWADADMQHQGLHCMPRTSDLNDELGQVEYVFSDKTGTLTCNIMDFRRFCVNGLCYGQGMTEIKRQVNIKMGKAVEDAPPPLPDSKRTPHVDLVDPAIDRLMESKTGKQYTAVRDFMLHLAINHEVVPEIDDGTGKIRNYSASSPDEAALCYGAQHFGYSFQNRDSSGVTIEVDGSMIRVQILATIKFNSARKRSSVIAKFTIPGEKERLVLYTKGADSIIMDRLAPEHKDSPETQQNLRILESFAEDGLRTLCLASRELTQEETDAWLKRWNEAQLATEKREEKQDAVSEGLEVNLTMNGITGIEDRLQEGVSDTIVKITRGGIKVWMLTGDKIETAVNIGVATGLLEAHEGVKGPRPVLTAKDYEDAKGDFQPDKLSTKLKDFAEHARMTAERGKMFEAMVIDGKCLETALEPTNTADFLAIGRVCRTVVCCRVSPKQKGAVVRLIKESEKVITLAIGDGANDCNMIQSADVGVGIRGLEGLQAFNVCDYGISQFRFLRLLLLVHGRWCYRRVAILANYMFYKNIVLVLPQYFLGCVSGFSGQKLYNDVLYQSYNVFFTFLPIMVFGVLDQDVSKKASLRYPELYTAGHQKMYMNRQVFVRWMVRGLWHALAVFFVPYCTMANGNITHSDGKANDIWLVGTVIFLLVCTVSNLTVLVETFYFHWLVHVGILLSALAWFMVQGYVSGLHGSVVNSELYGSTQRILGCPMVLLVIFVSCSSSVLIDIHLKGFECCFFPNILHHVQARVLTDMHSAPKRVK